MPSHFEMGRRVLFRLNLKGQNSDILPMKIRFLSQTALCLFSLPVLVLFYIEGAAGASSTTSIEDAVIKNLETRTKTNRCIQGRLDNFLPSDTDEKIKKVIKKWYDEGGMLKSKEDNEVLVIDYDDTGGNPKVSAIAKHKTTLNVALDRCEKGQDSDDKKENEKQKEEEKQVCNDRFDEFKKALSELVTSCTYRTKGSSCEDMVRKCLLCTKHPEKCVKKETSDDSEEKKGANQYEQLATEYKNCPLIAASSLEEAKKNFEDIRDRQSELKDSLDEKQKGLLEANRTYDEKIQEIDKTLKNYQQQIQITNKKRDIVLNQKQSEFNLKLIGFDNALEEAREKLEDLEVEYAEEKRKLENEQTEKVEDECLIKAEEKIKEARDQELEYYKNKKARYSSVNSIFKGANKRAAYGSKYDRQFTFYYRQCRLKDPKIANIKKRLVAQRQDSAEKYSARKRQIKNAITRKEKERSTFINQNASEVTAAAIDIDNELLKLASAIDDLQKSRILMTQKLTTLQYQTNLNVAQLQMKVQQGDQELNHYQKIYSLKAEATDFESTEKEILKSIGLYQNMLEVGATVIRDCNCGSGCFVDESLDGYGNDTVITMDSLRDCHTVIAKLNEAPILSGDICAQDYEGDGKIKPVKIRPKRSSK